MSASLLDEPRADSALRTSVAAERLRGTMAAVRLSFTWLGTRKSLTVEQKNQAADSFGAEGKFLSAGKKLLDTSHPAFKAVTSIKGRCQSYWRFVSLPYPEPGLRLIPQRLITEFDQQIAGFREELIDAVEELDRHYSDLRSAARRRLGDACATTDAESQRYALSCVRLRGADGQIAATDGQQALVQTGFTFPWTDDVLVPATGAFVAQALRMAAQVALGRTPDWLFLRADDWTVALHIEKDRRFPAIEAHLPVVSAASTTLVLAETDATFLDQAAQRLPGASDPHSPVTFDLNGVVVVRARSEDPAAVTDLVLRNSRRQGAELQVSSNRGYIRRAIQLGFRELHFRDAESPAFCCDDRRTYFWAVLGPEAVLRADANATRIESPSASRTAGVAPTKPAAAAALHTASSPPTRSPSRMTTPSTSRFQPPATDAAAAHGKTLSDLIEDAEQLRALLRDLLSRTSTLVGGLKRQRQQSHAMRTALKSLRAMQAIEV